MRRPSAAIWREGCGDFGDAQSVNCRFDDHLKRKLHARRVQVQRQHRVAPKAAQTAVEIVDGTAIEKSSNRGQKWIANIAVQWRHGTTRDSASEPVADDEV